MTFHRPFFLATSSNTAAEHQHKPGQSLSPIRYLAPAWIVAILAVFLSGCAILPGNDPLVVRAEQAARIGYATVDAFLRFEFENRKTYPGLKHKADILREHAPKALEKLREATKAYKARKAQDTESALALSLAAVETITRTAQEATP